MADHWDFVAAAYAIAVVVLGGYWRHLRRRERELANQAARTTGRNADRRLTRG
jgi:hypothetical protein